MRRSVHNGLVRIAAADGRFSQGPLLKQSGEARLLIVRLVRFSDSAGLPGVEKVAKQKSRRMHKTVVRAQPEFAKYIILIWNGREQALVFPLNVKHEDVLEYIQAEHPEVHAVSAGLYCDEPGAFWVGGQSDSLKLKVRPEDRRLLQRFLSSSDRRPWDLTTMAKEAAAAGKSHVTSGPFSR